MELFANELSLADCEGKTVYRFVWKPNDEVIGRPIKILRSPFYVAAVESIDGRLFPHDLTPPAFRSTIFYFLVGLHWWPVKTCKVSPTEMRPRTHFFIPFLFFSSRLASLWSSSRHCYIFPHADSQKRLIKAGVLCCEISTIRRAALPQWHTCCFFSSSVIEAGKLALFHAVANDLA